MNKRLNAIGTTLVLLDGKDARLDRHVKTLMVQRPILACILKETVMECKNMTVEQIEKCLATNIIVAEANSKEAIESMKVLELSQESLTADGEHVIFDILTVLFLPGVQEPIKVFINLELQKDEKPGYDVPVRGFFHCARIISSQLGHEFTNHPNDKIKYGNIKKVYSIWICSETAQKRDNSIDQYTIQRETILGSNSDNPRYDIMSVMVVNIGKKYETKETDSQMFLTLKTLFNKKLTAQEKIKMLDEIGIPVTESVEKEVEDMCTYTIETKKEGEKEGRLKEIYSSVAEKDYSLERGAQKAEMSIPDFKRAMTEAGFKLPEE